MDHDVAHRQVLQVQNTAKHIAIFLHHASLAVMKSNGAAQFVVGRKHMFGLADVGAKKPQGVLDDIFHRHNHGSENRDESPDEGRHHEGHAIGVDDGVSLGQHLTEKKHEHGHNDGRIEDARIAEDLQKHARRQRRGGDVHQIVAEQNRADQTLAHGGELLHDGGSLIAPAFELVHAGARGGRERSLGS